MIPRGVFVTGTDTGVGKTLASCALVHALRARGLRVHPFKPIAAGSIEHEGRRVNEDTLALIAAAGLEASAAERVTPILLREPMAPHIAAQREGRTIALEPILAAFDRLADFVVAEGVGGFKVPLGDRLDSVDLCRALALPVVMVVGLRLGCLNHALLTAQAIGAAGLPFAGWIANAIDPAMAVPDDNVAALRARLPAPLLGRLPHQERIAPLQLARHLDVSTLVAGA
jgi:dethiobiotin synthetase